MDVSLIWYIGGLLGMIAGAFTQDYIYIIIGILAFCLANLMEINKKITKKKQTKNGR